MRGLRANTPYHVFMITQPYIYERISVTYYRCCTCVRSLSATYYLFEKILKWFRLNIIHPIRVLNQSYVHCYVYYYGLLF